MWLLQTAEGKEEGSLTIRMPTGTVKTLGRAPVADFTVDAALVSRLHCRLSAFSTDELQVDDLDSTNGTFVNGERISSAKLAPGDRLRIGGVELMVSRSADA